MTEPSPRLLKLKEQLQEIEEAITAVLSGSQEYRIGSRYVKRAELTTLYRERDRLEKEIQAEQSGNGIFSVAVFDGR